MDRSHKDRLVIHVAQIPEGGREFKEDFPREWLTNIPEFSDDTSSTHLTGPIQVSGRVELEGENLRLTGHVRAELSTLCTRCGEPISYPLAGDFRLLLLKSRGEKAPAELELTPQDLDRGYYDGVMVDLAPFFQEEVALQVPVQTLCREDCKGLCPHCGANLNTESCACGQEPGDPRLAVLRGLKIEK
jgi:uncharacterized protein